MAPRRRIVMAIIAMGLFLILPVGAALAQDTQSVTTTLRVENPDTGEREPVEGVTITVTDAAGNEVGSGATDAEGVFLLEVPEPGTYQMLLDEATLPEGVVLANPDQNPATVRVEAGQTRATIFAVGSGEGGGGGGGGVTGRQVLQLTVEGIKFGLFIAMAAIGLSLIFGTTGLVNFAHGEMVGWGMLMAYFFNFYGLAGMFGWMEGWPAPLGSGINVIFAAGIAAILGGALGWLLDAAIFSKLRARGIGLISQMVVTIGLSLILRYIFLFAFGGSPRFYLQYTAQSALQFGPIDITAKDLVISTLSILILVGIGLFLIVTRWGKAMRAVADNRDLAESSGIDVQRVIRLVWVMGGSLAALGGVFDALAEQVRWDLGFRILLLVFAGVVLGGLGSAFGALVGSLIVGIGVQLSTIWIPTDLKNVGALVVLIVVLIVRPQGIMGKKERVG
jgi:branched-chain amino acid transport system permease protein